MPTDTQQLEVLVDPYGADSTGALVFESAAHPGTAPRSVAFATALVNPLAWCMLPVMIVTLVAVLEGRAVLHLVWIAFLGSTLIASLWTVYRMKAEVVEISITGGSAAVRTQWDLIARGKPESPWLPVLDLRVSKSALSVALGDAMYRLDRTDWPDFDALAEAFRSARHLED